MNILNKNELPNNKERIDKNHIKNNVKDFLPIQRQSKQPRLKKLRINIVYREER